MYVTHYWELRPSVNDDSHLPTLTHIHTYICSPYLMKSVQSEEASAANRSFKTEAWRLVASDRVPVWLLVNEAEAKQHVPVGMWLPLFSLFHWLSSFPPWSPFRSEHRTTFWLWCAEVKTLNEPEWSLQCVQFPHALGANSWLVEPDPDWRAVA